MTISLGPNQFRDLLPEAQSFSVTLRFHGRPERLTIPYDVITELTDPADQFALSLAYTSVNPASADDSAPKQVVGEEQCSEEKRSTEADAADAASLLPKPAPLSSAEVVPLDSFRRKRPQP